MLKFVMSFVVYLTCMVLFMLTGDFRDSLVVWVANIGNKVALWDVLSSELPPRVDQEVESLVAPYFAKKISSQ